MSEAHLCADIHLQGVVYVAVRRRNERGGWDNVSNGYIHLTSSSAHSSKDVLAAAAETSSQTTSGSSVRFDYKVKKKAPLGTQQLTFTGRDSAGNIRTAILRFTIS